MAHALRSLAVIIYATSVLKSSAIHSFDDSLCWMSSSGTNIQKDAVIISEISKIIIARVARTDNAILPTFAWPKNGVAFKMETDESLTMVDNWEVLLVTKPDVTIWVDHTPGDALPENAIKCGQYSDEAPLLCAVADINGHRQGGFFDPFLSFAQIPFGSTAVHNSTFQILTFAKGAWLSPLYTNKPGCHGDILANEADEITPFLLDPYTNTCIEMLAGSNTDMIALLNVSVTRPLIITGYGLSCKAIDGLIVSTLRGAICDTIANKITADSLGQIKCLYKCKCSVGPCDQLVVRATYIQDEKQRQWKICKVSY